MKLLLDEMHAPSIADALRIDGYDVLAVAGERDLRGTADPDLLEYASAESRAVVTENVADFSVLGTQWVAEGRPHAGIVFTGPRRFHRASVAYPGNVVAALRLFVGNASVEGDSWTWWL